MTDWEFFSNSKLSFSISEDKFFSDFFFSFFLLTCTIEAIYIHTCLHRDRERDIHSTISLRTVSTYIHYTYGRENVLQIQFPFHFIPIQDFLIVSQVKVEERREKKKKKKKMSRKSIFNLSNTKQEFLVSSQDLCQTKHPKIIPLDYSHTHAYTNLSYVERT